MKTKQKQSKMMLAMAGVILLLVALSISLTVAYFTAKTNSTGENIVFGTLKTNSESFGFTEIDTAAITSGRATAASTITLDNIVPGDVLTLDGKIDVVTNIDIFVRYKFDVTVTLTTDAQNAIKATAGQGATTEEQNDALATQVASMVNQVKALVFLSSDTTRIFDGPANWLAPTTADGWLYYKTKVNASTTGVTSVSGTSYTLPVINLTGGENANGVSVSIPETWNNYWQGAEVTIGIAAQAIQALHAGASGANITLSGTAQTDVDAIAASPAWDAVASNVLY